MWPTTNMPFGVAHFALVAYLFIAMPLLPTLMPVSLTLLEPAERRVRLMPFVALGVVVSAYLAVVVLTRPVGFVPGACALEYQTVIDGPLVWAALYVLAAIGPTLLSGYRSIVLFGVVNLVCLVLVAILYEAAFASLWCVCAAVASILVLVHMVRRRRNVDSLVDGEVPSPRRSTVG